MVSTAKILAPVITDNACRDQLLVSLDDIAAAVDNFKNHATAGIAENKSAEKATESVMGAVADLVTYLKDSEDDPIMVARDDIVAACDEVLASKTAREAVKGVQKSCGSGSSRSTRSRGTSGRSRSRSSSSCCSIFSNTSSPC